jgi:hypothetical protein
MDPLDEEQAENIFQLPVIPKQKKQPPSPMTIEQRIFM